MSSTAPEANNKSIQSLLSPMDEHNEQLVDNVHPLDWRNPKPKGRYNLVVIGAGTAGLVTAAGAAGLGARVALIERNLMGGDCLNVGCVPSKTLISSSRLASTLRRGAEFGIEAGSPPNVNFPAVMARVRRIRAGISSHDSAKRFSDLGVDVFIGQGSFESSDTIRVGEQSLKFKKAVIATGARAAALPIEGLEEVGYLTNETVFNLTALPKRLAVIGAGPIGGELAQAFQRLGSSVTLINNKDHILPKEDENAAAILQDVFIREGISLLLGTEVTKVEASAEAKVIHCRTGSNQSRIEVDQILVAVGRAPNVEGLNLEAVGVDYDPRHGVKVDDNLRTSNSRIFAAGDICMKHKFTHAADFAARTVIQNALFFGRKKLSALTIPWCTYTSPEIAHVGLYPSQAKEQGVEMDTYQRNFEQVDRAIAEGETEGFVKIHCKKGSDEILGATIVGSNAGDLISEITVAMVNNIGLGKIANVIHPYPTQAEAIRQAGDLYNKTRLTPFVAKLLSIILRLTR